MKGDILKRDIWNAHLAGEEFFMKLRRYNASEGDIKERDKGDALHTLLTKENNNPPCQGTRWLVHQIAINLIDDEDLLEYGEVWRWRHYDYGTPTHSKDNRYAGEQGDRTLKRFFYGFAETMDGKHRLKLETLAHTNFLFKSAYVAG